MNKLLLTAVLLVFLPSSLPSFLPTVSPRLPDEEALNEDIVILNRISLINEQSRRDKDVRQDSFFGGEPTRSTTANPMSSNKRKKYLKKIVVRRRPHRKDRIGLHEKGYRMIGPMEYAKEDVVRQTTPSLLLSTPEVRRGGSSSKIPYIPRKSSNGFKKTKDFMNSVKIINGIKLKKWKTKQPVQKQEGGSKKQSFAELNLKKPNTINKNNNRDSSIYFGDKLSDYEYFYDDEENFSAEELNVDYLSKTDVSQIQLLRESYFSTTQKYSDVTDVDVFNLGYTIAPLEPQSRSTTSEPLTKSTPSPSNELLPTPVNRDPTTTPSPVFDRSHLPKAFEFVPEEYLASLTAQDILFADPLTHTHPLGTHPLLPVHKGFDIPHSHPPYEDEPVVRLLPKLSTLMKSFLFPVPEEESSSFGNELLPPNPKRHASLEENDSDISYSYGQNASHFSHGVTMPGHRQFHSQALAGKKLKKILVKARKLEESHRSTTPLPTLSAESSNLQYSPIIPQEFVSSLEPRTGTKIDYARRKRAFADMDPIQ